ncbi:thiol reductant ABC exporter subunit CydD [Oryzobacter sp. R7]|uniref:thiol reductant ABC exporter subunit CydD n=1 Tax=Oryzobacter faecalis TaxID=3388656 RepID=UPI00398CB089
MRPFDPHLLRAAPAARGPVVLLAVTGIAQGVATIGLALALARLVVAVVAVEDRPDAVAPAAVVLAAVFGVRALLGWVVERVAAWAGVEVTAALRERLLARWLDVPAEARPDPDRAVTLAAHGVATVEPYAARFLPALVSGAVVPVLAVLALVWVDWLSALVVVLTLPLLPFFAALIGRATQAETERRWVALSSLAGHFLDVVRGLPTLVGYGRAERQVEVVEDVSRRHRVATMRTLRLAFTSSAALELLASVSVAIVAVVVGLRLTHGSMTLTAGLTAILLAPEAYWPVRRVGAEFHAAADGAEALDAILTELAPPSAGPVTTDRMDPGAGAPTSAGRGRVEGREGAGASEEVGVRVADVAYTYPGAASPVLTGVSLAAGPGLTALTGPSGVGKSTLLELVAGLRSPDEGTVDAGRAHLVTQRPFLPAGTLRDALRLGNDAPDEALWDALRTVGLDGVVAGLPESLATPVGDDGFGLSAGQRARVALARAALSTAPVLLVDEPTAHLDADAAGWVHRLLVDLGERRTVLVVTHRPELVALADHHVALAAPAEVSR